MFCLNERKKTKQANKNKRKVNKTRSSKHNNQVRRSNLDLILQTVWIKQWCVVSFQTANLSKLWSRSSKRTRKYLYCILGGFFKTIWQICDNSRQFGMKLAWPNCFPGWFSEQYPHLFRKNSTHLHFLITVADANF